MESKAVRTSLGENALNPNMADMEEVNSHSSVLTNIRVSNRLVLVEDSKVNAWYRPTFDNVLVYFANTYALFDETFVLITDEHLKTIVEDFGSIWGSIHNPLMKHQDMRTMWELCIKIDRINRIIRGNMQKVKYFFRTSIAAPRKMEDVLRILEQGGGFFGGKPKSQREKEEKEKAAEEGIQAVPPEGAEPK